MQKTTLTVIDGFVTRTPEREHDALVQGESVSSVLQQLEAAGWRLESPLPKIFQPGEVYTITLVKG